MANIFYMEKKGGKLVFAGDHQEGTYRAYVDGLKDHQIMKMELKVKRDMKTNPQLGYWHAVVLPSAVQGFLDMGHDTFPSTILGETIEYQTDDVEVDKYLKAKYAKCSKTDPIGKAKMTDEQMSGLIDWTIKWAAEWLHTVIPEPTERIPNDQ